MMAARITNSAGSERLGRASGSFKEVVRSGLEGIIPPLGRPPAGGIVGMGAFGSWSRGEVMPQPLAVRRLNRYPGPWACARIRAHHAPAASFENAPRNP